MQLVVRYHVLDHIDKFFYQMLQLQSNQKKNLLFLFKKKIIYDVNCFSYSIINDKRSWVCLFLGWLEYNFLTNHCIIIFILLFDHRFSAINCVELDLIWTLFQTHDRFCGRIVSNFFYYIWMRRLIIIFAGLISLLFPRVGSI